MAITKSFAGRNINVPGAYSTQKVDNSGGGALESNDTIFLVGESSKGAPGDVEGIQEYTNAQLNQLVAKYGEGPLIDCALAASRPSPTTGIGGAGRYLVWKTNSTTQASLDINEATDSDRLFVVKDREWGAGGDDLSVTMADGTVPARQKVITIKRLNDTSESLGENEGLSAIQIEYTGDATTAGAVISGLTKAAKTLVVTLAGDQTDGSVNLNISLKDYTMKTLADFINVQTGYSASLVTNKYAAKAGNELDSIASTSILTATQLYRLQEEILEVLNSSARVLAELDAVPRVGLPVNQTDAFLSGGAQGASVNSDFSTGMSQSLAEEYNVLLPCISRDAADDIAAEGFTDSGSTYDIASVLTAEQNHLILREDVESRKEAQGFAGIREAAKADVYSQAAALGYQNIQLCMQDVRVNNQFNTLAWQHPHVFAAMCAGIRLGTEVGEPLTHKRLNAVSVGHFVDEETGLEGGDFNADLDKKEAINQGVTFAEKSGSIFRIVVDNTTYGIDDSFVFNRGSVVEAAQFVAKDIRKVAEDVFVGKKLPAGGAARSIKAVIRNRLIELNQPDVNIISSSDDAPNGFVEETFVVEVEGNTARVQVEIKPVQGLDFIFITFTLGDIRQSA